MSAHSDFNYDELQDRYNSIAKQLENWKEYRKKDHERYDSLLVNFENLQEKLERKNIENDELQYKYRIACGELHHYKEIHKYRALALNKVFNENVEAFPYLAGIMADYLTYDIEVLAKELDWGHNIERLHKVATIRDIRKNAEEQIKEAKVAIYQLNYLLQMYPALDDVLNTDFREITFNADVIPEYDPIRKYLSKQEWEMLSETEKNQLALDNYIKSHRKTNWQIGRDYEIFIGQQFERAGYSVEYFGENNGLEDLGRDLICTKGNDVKIVQCKYWGKEKKIHEKHIFQLFGTTMTFCIENGISMDNVKPVFITNISLSQMASTVAKQLNVEVIEERPLEDFPRIKCNIGRDEYGKKVKIYHLPMDQQYDAVKIENEGEFWAKTVAEAEEKGFRRAFRWQGSNE